MKFLSRVVWSEGMHLGPQHFQTQSRYFEDTLAFVGSSLWSYPWGLLNCTLDHEAVQNGSVVVLSASGILPDGLPFDIGDSDAVPDALNLRDIFSPTEPELLIYLSLPRRRDSGQNCDTGTVANDARYIRTTRSLRDETTGLDEYDVPLGKKSFRLLAAPQMTDNFVVIPIARVVRNTRGDMMFDPDFVPPCLRIRASEILMLRLKRLLDNVEERCQVVRQERRPTSFEAGSSALDVAHYWFLHAMQSAVPGLRHMQSAKQSHPEELYLELSRLAGALCTFAFDSDAAELPPYDHGAPGPVFQFLDNHIRRHLEIVLPSNTLQLRFKLTRPYIHEADVPDERCLRRARWILGVRSALAESTLLDLVPRLVKVCSGAAIARLVQNAIPGLRLTHLPVPPSALHAQADMQYFAVEITESEPCWKLILQTRRVGVYIPGEIKQAGFDLTVILELS